MKKAVILLSGGLDSLVALGFPQSEYRIRDRSYRACINL